MARSHLRFPFLVAARLGWLRVGREVGVFVFGQSIVLAMAVVQLDVVVDWPALWALVAEWPAWLHGCGLALVVALMGLGARRLVRRTWLGAHELLLRQPLTAFDLGLASFGLLGLIASPLPVIGGLATGSLVTAVTWGLLGPLGVAGLAGPWVVGLAAVVGVAFAATLAALHPIVAGLVWLGALGMGISVLGRAARAWAIEGTPPTGLRVPRPADPLVGLLHRDAIVLARDQSRHLTEPWLVAVAVGVVVALARRNNADPSGFVAGAGLVGIGVASLVAHGGLTALVQRLGRAFDPPQWPLRPRQRAGALVLLAAGLTSPSWAVAAVGGFPVLSVVDQLAQVAIWWGLAGAAAWTVARRPGEPTLGAFVWWVLALLTAGFVRAGVGLVVGAAALGITGWALIRRLEQGRTTK